MEQVDGDEKKSISYLNRLKPRERKKIRRLVLIQGRSEYYSQYVLEQYLQELSSLEYIEIRNKSGKFVALIPISELKHTNHVENNLLGEFIHILEQSEVLQRYANSVITAHLSEDAGLIESLKLMRKKRINKVVVLDENGIFIGLLYSSSVEKRIADDVLAAREKV